MAACFHLSLFAHKRVEVDLAGSTSDPLTQPSSSSSSNNFLKRWKAMESEIVVAPNQNLRAETVESLADWRTRSNCREDGAHQILKETTAVPTELFAEEAAVDLLKRCEKTCPLQKMFINNCPKAR